MVPEELSTRFSTDPASLEREIAALPLTFEASPDTQLSAKDEERLLAIFPTLAQGHPRTVRDLRKMVERCPQSPPLKNHLLVALTAAGLQAEAKALSARIRREHPDYLFSRTNDAHALISEGRISEVPDLLGSGLSLAALKPERRRFHVSEVVAFYSVVARFHSEQGNLDAAQAIHRALSRDVDASHPGVQALGEALTVARIQQVRTIIDEDKARTIEVRPAPTPPVPYLDPPPLHHSELSCLYERDLDLEPRIIHALLALPRETLIADLEAIIMS